MESHSKFHGSSHHQPVIVLPTLFHTTTINHNIYQHPATRQVGRPLRKVEPEFRLRSHWSVPSPCPDLENSKSLRSNNFRQIRFMICLVVETTPLKNMSSSVGMMTFPKWKNKTCSKPPSSSVFLEFPNLN